ncbi:MAG: hypothetical protein J3Q66DRAFT_375595 [Benniella sp.]|nr:MAG: hypothetical protein J3Q66DRAFT_375595 [Benniella sp.]
MLRYVTSSTTLTFFTVIVTFLLGASFSPFAHAQKFQPTPGFQPCSTFIEGQGLYIFGGGTLPSLAAIYQAFMIDLSVSWETSDPVYKMLRDGPGAVLATCTLLPNGEDIFILDLGVPYIYTVKSNSWETILHNKLPTDRGMVSATDPESKLTYVVQGLVNNTGIGTMYTLDLAAKTLNATTMPNMKFEPFFVAAWSAHLRSMLFLSLSQLYIFTPSKVSGSSNGWSILETTGDKYSYNPLCFIPAYGGTKMVIYTFNQIGAIYILDVTTRTWKKGALSTSSGGTSCAVSGDQFIVWGGFVNNELISRTQVYDMRTDKWTSKYVAPPHLPATASPTLPTPSQHVPDATTTSTPDDTSMSDKKLVIIIAIVGTLLTIILTAISVYLGLTKRSKTDIQSTSFSGPSSSSLNTEESVDTLIEVSFKRPAGLRGPAYHDTISTYPTGLKRPTHKQENHLHQGFVGEWSDPRHPHAIIMEPSRTHTHATVMEPAKAYDIHEGAFRIRPLSQHPHATVNEVIAVSFHGKEELE